MKTAFAITAAQLLLCGAVSAESTTDLETERRLAKVAQYLSSDNLAGRGLGTPGLRQAADYVAAQFADAGLNTNLIDGGPFQTFDVTIGAELGEGNYCRIVGPQTDVQLQPGVDFNPLAIGGSGEFDLPLVFAGYGITAPEAEYDDYQDLDVQGKTVIVMRHEPQQNNPHSAFNGTDHSEHAPFKRKISNAYQHGAAAVIFVTDEYEINDRMSQWKKRIATAEEELATDELPSDEDRKRIQEKLDRYRGKLKSEQDPVLDFTYAGQGGQSREIPVLHCSREVVDRILAAAHRPSLSELESVIDHTLEPDSFELPDFRVQGQVEIEREQVEVRNVLGVLEGTGPFANETIIVGAHLDHLGLGGEGSAAPGSTEIHNGADDNASGVATLIEVARQLAARDQPLSRRVLFIAFTGEERGLLGSEAYARDPLYPLEDTVAMVNFDMVGRMKDNSLVVYGTGTSPEFGPWIDDLNSKFGFEITRNESGYGPSDHTTFYTREIPVLHFFTGSHADYHKPTDDFHLLNVAGMRRIGDIAAEIVARIADAPERIAYVEIAPQPTGDSRKNPRPYFGSLPDFASGGGGYGISGTGPGSPADEAGLKAGDKIVRLGEFKVGNLEDFDSALRKFEAGDKVPVVVQRGDEEVELTVTLDPPR